VPPLALPPQIAKWGTHALAAAAKRLVEAAVLDRGNEVFVLVGDTTGEPFGAALLGPSCIGHVGSFDGCATVPPRLCDGHAPVMLWARSDCWAASQSWGGRPCPRRHPAVPLYHPAMMWQQLMHEERSRLDACWHSVSVCVGWGGRGGGGGKRKRARIKPLPAAP
jgi:hypothetical protein